MQKRLDLDTVSDTAPAVIGVEQRFDLNSVSDTPIDSCEHSDYCTSCLCSRWNINCLCRNIITQNQTIYNNISQRAKCLCLRAGGVRTCYASTLFPEQTMATSSNELDSEVRGLDHQPTPLNLNEAPHMSGDRDDFQLQLYNYTQYKNQMAQNVFDCDTYCACDNDVASTIRDLREIGNLAKPCNATVPNLADPTQYEVTIEDLGNEQQSESSESLVAGKSPKKANSRNQPTDPDFRTPHERKTDKNQTKKQKNWCDKAPLLPRQPISPIQPHRHHQRLKISPIQPHRHQRLTMWNKQTRQIPTNSPLHEHANLHLSR